MVQVYSQNGWPAFHTAEEGNFVRFTAGGREWWAANDDAAVVAGEYIDRFNTDVEPVVYPGETYDDWSFADRLVRGSTATVSNHGSATAWDVNATRHLLGKDNTFSDADETRLLAIEHDITDDAGRPVLRWGGSYSGRKDEMHIEINATAKQVGQAADKIRKRDDVTKAELIAAVVDALKQDIVPNVDYRTGKSGGNMSMVAAARLGDEKADEILALARADARANTALQAAVTAQGAALAALAVNSAPDVRQALDDFRTGLKADLAALDVRVVLGGDDSA